MPGSSVRPRSRTTTSCTECRRRKQRCNQAKNRPCNNCLRRYPPVICTYETSRRASPVGSVVDVAEDEGRPADSEYANDLLTPSYQTKASHSVGNSLTTTSSLTSYNSQQPTYSSMSFSNSYSQMEFQPQSPQPMSTPTSASGLASTSGGSFPGGTITALPYSSSSVQNYDNIYFTASDASQGPWLSPSGNTSSFLESGTGASTTNDLASERQNSSLFYFGDPDTENQE